MKTNDNDPFKDSAITTILVVSDILKSKDFYVDVLGAKIFREYGGDSLVLEFLGNWILLVTPGGPTEDKPEIHFAVTANTNIVSHSYTIRVKDCKRSYQILKERGADFITPPFIRGAESRCFFRDPDGHLFEISEFRG
ncbi:catechol 2,3-dioxygenase-like lactoylglutathione lyase family enzyme [Christiangramia gaetbulicola]|uniref:Catechol 2,3-dioxygenase-like lactoylglutathione lyase family enzyme n=1 Tax=Christiangramia gaetbulicola TaxID=703340 RepID=A0A2T6ACJ2_9FLAO|nr:VOC family protein [Christiangramia gaetbulicola]PTX41496.1 catechol 2,3-dioxygenase-like lactoylglutathione lyase family enzyme [Christiangramia gaetbulicola]